MLTRRHTLKGRGFQRKEPETIARDRAATRAANIDMLLATTGRPGVNMGGTTSGVPVDKEQASQSNAYQVAVRSIGYCMRCGCSLKKGEGQFAHADEGKGMSLKTDVRRGSLCCPGCHFHVGTSGRMPRELRRQVERFLAWKTRTALRWLNLWPKSLPDTWREADADPLPNPEAPCSQ